MPESEQSKSQVASAHGVRGRGGVWHPSDSAHKAELDADVDSLLDEIDSVLENNAEEFVRSFVQKGGQ